MNTKIEDGLRDARTVLKAAELAGGVQITPYRSAACPAGRVVANCALLGLTVYAETEHRARDILAAEIARALRDDGESKLQSALVCLLRCANMLEACACIDKAHRNGYADLEDRASDAMRIVMDSHGQQSFADAMEMLAGTAAR